MLASEDHGKDLASVQNLLKKHQLMEADIAAHEVCLHSLSGAIMPLSRIKEKRVDIGGEKNCRGRKDLFKQVLCSCQFLVMSEEKAV